MFVGKLRKSYLDQNNIGFVYLIIIIFNFIVNLCFDQNEFIVDENEAEVTIKMSIDERPPEDFIVTIRDDPINAFGRLCIIRYISIDMKKPFIIK